MLAYTMGVEERSRWLISTPSPAALASAAIAERVGFASEGDFSCRFEQMVGQGPRAYR